MKGAFIALTIGTLILVLLFLQIDIYKSNSGIDVHLHDTYFIFNYVTVIVFLFLFLGTCFAIGGMVYSYFKSKMFLILMLLFVAIDTYYVFQFYKTFSNTEIISSSKK